MDFGEFLTGLLVALLIVIVLFLSVIGASAIYQDGPFTDIDYMSGARELILNCEADLPRTENCVLIAVPENKEQTR